MNIIEYQLRVVNIIIMMQDDVVSEWWVAGPALGLKFSMLEPLLS